MYSLLGFNRQKFLWATVGVDSEALRSLTHTLGLQLAVSTNWGSSLPMIFRNSPPKAGLAYIVEGLTYMHLEPEG